MPVIAGIVANEFISSLPPTFILSLSGILVMSASFFIPKKAEFNLRWVFGAGLFIFLFSLTTFRYQQQKQQSSFIFPPQNEIYIGFITDIPLEKTRSVQGNAQLTYPVRKKVVLYFAKSPESYSLQPGDEVLFSARMQPFKNMGNPDDFDYKRFMRIKGYAASAFVPGDLWKKTGRQVHSLYVFSQKLRAKALDFYKSFGLDADEYAFVSALTLGYKANLSDDVQEAFRASGTSHVLAVSGLHVGIIYLIISSLLSFLGTSGKKYILKQVIIVCCLWAYAFLTGLSVSVIRAAIMLSVFSFGNLLFRKGFSYNNLAVAAFIILMFRPMSLFEVGFQMSFAAVVAILFFKPRIDSFYTPRNKYMAKVWNLLTLSVAAQIGVFPLVLHYFGTFPTYFFMTNLLIVPLVGIVVYAILPVIFFAFFANSGFVVTNGLYAAGKWMLSFLSRLVLRIVYLFESLPFAQITDQNITTLQTALIFVIVFSIFLFIGKRRFVPLFASLVATFLFILSFVFENGNAVPARLVLFNRPRLTELNYISGKQKTPFIPRQANAIVPHPSKRIVRISSNIFADKVPGVPFRVDYLILSEDHSFSMKALKDHFIVGMVIVDSSLSASASARIAKECREMGIKVYEVSQTGAFSVIL